MATVLNFPLRSASCEVPKRLECALAARRELTSIVLEEVEKLQAQLEKDAANSRRKKATAS